MPTTPHQPQAPAVRVWDRWVRLSHWVLAAAFFLAYFVVEEPLALHVWAGYLVGALVAIRLVWGIIGPRRARFAEFVPSPAQLTAHVRDLAHGRERRYLGHNPLGGMMILALLAALAGTVVSGLMVHAADEQAGPLGGWYADGQPPLPLLARARADAGDEEAHAEHGEGHAEADRLEELHEFFANLILFLVGLHVAGVAFTSRRERQNLVRAMVTGRKRAPDPANPG